MSRIRQPPEPDIRTSAMTFPSGYLFRWRAKPWAQLVCALRGVMTVETPAGLWVIPPHQAMWVPAGNALRVEMGGEVSMRTLYLNPAIVGAFPAACRVVQVSPLLRELLLATIRLGTLDRRKPAERHLIEVILDQIAVLPLAPLDLPAPRDKRGLSAAQLVRGNSQRRLRLADVTREAGASPRTLERLFKAETGLSFGAWCRRARMLEALQRLAAGGSVTATSLSVGYESLSAFVAAFGRAFGTTPGRYFRIPASGVGIQGEASPDH